MPLSRNWWGIKRELAPDPDRISLNVRPAHFAKMNSRLVTFRTDFRTPISCPTEISGKDVSPCFPQQEIVPRWDPDGEYANHYARVHDHIVITCPIAILSEYRHQ